MKVLTHIFKQQLPYNQAVFSTTIGEFEKAKKIASNFAIEIKRSVTKYTAAGFPSKFVLFYYR